MASFAESLPEDELEMESHFLKISRWAMASMKIIGHFPYTVRKQYFQKSQILKSSTLTFNRISLPIISSLFLMTVFIVWLLNYYIRLVSKLRFRKIFGPTENLAYTFMILSTSVVRLHTQIRSLFYAKRNLAFWRRNCILLKKFQNAGYNFKGQWFTRLEWETGCIFFICTALIMAQTGYVHIYTAIMSTRRLNTAQGRKSFWPMFPDNEERFGSGLFWTSVTYLRIANCWLLFFIRLYTVLFQQITRDSIKNLEQKPKIFITELTFKNSESVEPGKTADENTSIFGKLLQLRNIKGKYRGNGNTLVNRKFLLENRAETNLLLFVEIRKLARQFNDLFGTEIIYDVSAITNVTIYFFFACFWLKQGYTAVIFDVGLSLSLNLGKVVLLGWVCGKLMGNSKAVVPAIIRSCRMHELDTETRRKLQIWKIVGELNPVTIKGKGFFVLDASFITAMVSGVSAFLITLVEFRLKEKK